MKNLHIQFTVSVSNNRYHSTYGEKQEAKSVEVNIEIPESAIKDFEAGNILKSLLPAAIAKYNYAIENPDAEEEE